jgi:hypothetical protein
MQPMVGALALVCAFVRNKRRQVKVVLFGATGMVSMCSNPRLNPKQQTSDNWLRSLPKLFLQVPFWVLALAWGLTSAPMKSYL